MNHSQTDSAGEDMVMEQKGSPKEPGEGVETDEVEETNGHCASETQNQRQTDGTQNSNSDESKRKKRLLYPNLCARLYRAACKGNWQEVKVELDVFPYFIRDPITEGGDTTLHIAAAANQPNFVKELLKLMEVKDLELKNKYGQTALYLAAASGNVIIAKEMVERNDKLTLIRCEGEMKCTPLYIAALLGRREMVSYLFSVTPFECLSPDERIELLVATISYNLFDIALIIMIKDKRLATAKDINGRTALYELARKPFAIESKSQLSVSKRCLNSWFKGKDVRLLQTIARKLVEGLWNEVRLLQGPEFSKNVEAFLFEAAKMGNAELLIIVIRSYPDLIWKTDSKCRTIFHIAILYRQKSVFNLIYEISAIKYMIFTYVDDKCQNILHLAGKLAPPSRLNMASGAAFQMQREILWFKEVERFVPPLYVNMKSNDCEGMEGLTPWDLFTKEHEKLRADGEKWMKDTVNFYIVVATLISAVVFAAVITVPGGSNQDNGTPILLKSIWFRVFFISNTIALLSSSASILIYLSILTSRFAEVDFLTSLPLKWVLGVITLVISIVGMVVAFSATCFLVLESELTWLPIVIIALAGVLIISFVSQHCQLWVGIIHSASLFKYLFGQRKNRLF